MALANKDDPTSFNSTFTISVRAVASGHSEKAAMPVHLAEVK